MAFDSKNIKTATLSKKYGHNFSYFCGLEPYWSFDKLYFYIGSCRISLEIVRLKEFVLDVWDMYLKEMDL